MMTEINTLQARVEKALEEIRPFLKRDGGDIRLIGITPDNQVEVELLGNCVGCSVNQMTLKSGVEMTVKKHAPEIDKVVDVSQNNPEEGEQATVG